MPKDQPPPIYDNPRTWRVRVAQAAVWGFGAVLLWLPTTLDPARDGPADRIVAYIGAGLAIAAVIGMEMFLRLYVVRIVRDGEGWAVTSLATLWTRRTFIAQGGASLGETRREQGRFGAAPSFDNAWAPLRLRGRRLPFIIDATPPAKINHAALAAMARRAGGGKA